MESADRHDLASRLRGIYEKFAAGDPGPMHDFLAGEVVYHLPGKHLGGGRLQGRVSVFERIAGAAASCEGPPSISLVSVMACGAFAVSVERFVARRRGVVLDQSVCVVWRMVGERCVEVWSHFSDQDACDRFWS